MKRFLPRNFRFSPLITLTCVVLALLMLRAAQWQWSRYHEKVALVESYNEASRGLPAPFPAGASSPADFAKFLHQRVEVRGRYDFERQMIVTNRTHASGPGHWLLTPLQIEEPGQNEPRYLIVSRGFIPFADREAETWEKYNDTPEVTIEGVIQPSEPHTSFLTPKNPETGEGQEFVRRWLYPELDKMARQFPYPVITDVFLQKLGGPSTGQFPAESVSIKVPPSTHFGYTIEWTLLALATLTVGFLLQAFPRRRGERPPSDPAAIHSDTFHLNGSSRS